MVGQEERIVNSGELEDKPYGKDEQNTGHNRILFKQSHETNRSF